MSARVGDGTGRQEMSLKKMDHAGNQARSSRSVLARRGSCTPPFGNGNKPGTFGVKLFRVFVEQTKQNTAFVGHLTD